MMRVSLFAVLLIFGGCFFNNEQTMFQQAEEASEKKNYSEAAELYAKIVKRYGPEKTAVVSAERLADIYLFSIRDFNKALYYNRYVVLHSAVEKNRDLAQQRIAQIVFENLSDYQQAVVEYSRLLDTTPDLEKKIYYQKQIAKSYYFLDQFYQAEAEINSLIGKVKKEEDRYDLLLLKGHIKLGTKNIDEAIRIYSDLINQYPDQAAKDNIALHLAIGFEEKRDFARAIEVLDEIKSDYETPEFIDQKIENLKKRQLQMPGAKGLRK